ncbi:hypothetical protein AB6A23_03245 [Paenibacillus tarimensis]
MSSNMRTIAPLGRFDPVHPVTPYAHYPFRDEQSIVSPYDYPQSSARRWARSAKKTAENISSLLQELRAARLAALGLVRASSSAWEDRIAVSSNMSAISGSAVRGAARQRCDIMVSRLASSQINKGYTLLKTGRSVVGEGVHRFIISTAGAEAELFVTIKAGDQNGRLIGKLANAINGAELGVTALILEDRNEQTLQLELKSDLSGSAAAFSMVDSGDGKSIAATGIGRIGQVAEDALYQIDNGDWLTSGTNSAVIGNGKVTLFFHETTPNPVTLIVKTNAGSVANQLRSVVVKVNRLTAVIESMSDHLNPLLKNGLLQVMNSAAAQRTGMKQQPSGEWKVDRTSLEKAFEDEADRTKLDLTGPDGWAMSLARMLERFEQMPAQAMINPAAVEAGHFTLYKSSMRSYWQMPVSGWIMNSRW